MIYIDEEAQDKYHKAPALLQVICQILEANLAEHMIQLELIEIDKKFDMHIAMLGVSDCSFDVLQHAAEMINRKFARTDKKATCIIENEDAGIITVRITKAKDFSHLL